jgi:hypothetical protein
MFFARRRAKHAASRGPLPRQGLTALAVSVAVGASLVIAPVVDTLTASPAAAAPPTITAVGTTTSMAGTSLTALPDNPQNLGDVLVVVSEQDNNAEVVNSISGGGVTTWHKAVRYVGMGEPRAYEIWYGTVTATGGASITFNLSSPPSGMTAEYEAQEFTAGDGPGTIWTLDTAGHAETNPASRTVNYPLLNAAGAGEVYFGFADMPSTPASGSNPGFSYFTTADFNQVAYNPSVGSGAVQPTSTEGASHFSSSVAVLLGVQAPPAVTGISPSGGPLAGGALVTVTGTNFTDTTVVDFGATAGTGVVVNPDGTSLSVTAPSEPPGTVDVTVTTPAGTSASGPADRFTYFIPTVVSPGTAPTAGNTAGYWMVGADGSVFSFGAPFEGSLPGIGVHVKNIVAVVPTSDSKGYWMIGSDGGVFAFGDAGFVGSLPGLKVHVSNIVGVVPTSTGKGYWMIGSDGGVFAFGDAGFVGSLPGLNVHVAGIVGAVATSTGQGYWMVGNDGGVFAFGDAGFVGSLPGLNVHVANIVGVVATSSGQGYWMVGNDGGVFAFGDAGFVGSIPGLGIHVSNIVAFARM